MSSESASFGINRSSRIGLEDLSRPADARQQPSHDSVVRLAAAALKLVLLDGPFGEGRGLICRLSLVLRKRHPLANDFPTRLVVFHVCGSLGCNFSTRPETTASFTASRNSSGLAHAIRTASMWRASRFPPPECLEAGALPPKNGLRLNDLRRTDQSSLDAFIDSHFEIRSAKPPRRSHFTGHRRRYGEPMFLALERSEIHSGNRSLP